VSEIMWFEISVLNYAVTWRVRILKLHDRDLKSFQNTLYCFIYLHNFLKSIKHIIKLMQAHFLSSTHRLPEGNVQVRTMVSKMPFSSEMASFAGSH
jgi:hypothetical protein